MVPISVTRRFCLVQNGRNRPSALFSKQVFSYPWYNFVPWDRTVDTVETWLRNLSSHEACQSVHCVARLVTLRRRCVRRARLFRPSLVDWDYSKIADVVQSVRGPLPCMSQAPPGCCTRRAPDSALLCRAPPSRHSAWRVKVSPIVKTTRVVKVTIPLSCDWKWEA